MKGNIRKSRVIKKSDNFPSYINSLCALSDGRLIIGGENLIIYNMKTYKIDIHIDTHICIKEIKELSNNRLFYYTFSISSEGPWVNENIDNYIIEINNNKYTDLTDCLPKTQRHYNIMNEFSDSILIAGRYYKEQNNQIDERIDKLMKIDNKFQIVSTLKIANLINFILLKNNLIAVLFQLNKNTKNTNCLNFYDAKIFKLIKNINVENTEYISMLNEKFILLGYLKGIIVYDYINFINIKKILIQYPLSKIYICENFVYIGESEKYDYKLKSCKNRIVEYEYDGKGNFKKIYSYYKPQNRLIDFVKVKDGRLITCSSENVKIWY